MGYRAIQGCLLTLSEHQADLVHLQCPLSAPLIDYHVPGVQDFIQP